MRYKQIYDNYLKAEYLNTSPKATDEAIRNYQRNYSILLPKDKAAKILDIGCGTGNFLAFLKKQGYENFEGVDIGREQIEFCKKHITEKVRCITDINSYLKDNPDTFGLIFMLNVIEHFPKETIIDILGLAKSALRENGRLIIQTANMSNFSSGISRYADFTHEIGFTDRSLTQLLKSIGFTDVSIFGNKIPLGFSLKRILWYFMQKVWFSILKIIYLIELGSDSPRVFSKLIIAVAKK